MAHPRKAPIYRNRVIVFFWKITGLSEVPENTLHRNRFLYEGLQADRVAACRKAGNPYINHAR